MLSIQPDQTNYTFNKTDSEYKYSPLRSLDTTHQEGNGISLCNRRQAEWYIDRYGRRIRLQGIIKTHFNYCQEEEMGDEEDKQRTQTKIPITFQSEDNDDPSTTTSSITAVHPPHPHHHHRLNAGDQSRTIFEKLGRGDTNSIRLKTLARQLQVLFPEERKVLKKALRKLTLMYLPPPLPLQPWDMEMVPLLTMMKKENDNNHNLTKTKKDTDPIFSYPNTLVHVFIDQYVFEKTFFFFG